MTLLDRNRFYKLALETIFHISKILSGSIYGNDHYQQIVEALSNYIGVKRGMILIHDDLSDRLFVKGYTGIDKNIIEKLDYRQNEGIVGRVFSLGVSMMIPDISEEPKFLNKIDRGYSSGMSFYAVTIKDSENKKYGVLAIDRDASEIINLKIEFDLLSIISTMLGNYIKSRLELDREIKQLKDYNSRLTAQITEKYNFKGLIGNSKTMRIVQEKIAVVVKSKSPVLILGESGTGKEVVAKTIHYNSDRKNRAFMAVNCAAIPSELMESEIFGYEKGAFTGAVAQKKGKFEMANGGTLFLDEIGDMPLNLQSKLLRIIQEKEFERVGGNTTIKTDVRIIAATNKNILEEIKKGNFRADLYYRLNVFTIYLPPLRNRKEDIPDIINYKMKKLNKEYGLNKKIDKKTVLRIMGCNFPGNIRELENCIERGYFNSERSVIPPSDISCDLCTSSNCESEDILRPIEVKEKLSGTSDEISVREFSKAEPSEVEKILDALRKCGWVQAKAARYLGITVRQLNYRIAKFKIDIKKYSI